MDEEETVQLEGQPQRQRRQPKEGFWGFVLRPIYWFRMLSDELHWSFVLGVVIVYGINQGLSMGLSRISIQYYMKDDQKLRPSEAQVIGGIIQIPWIVKPLWGLLTDTIPIIGSYAIQAIDTS
ncbi:unnamed protein product [Ilex paraguariensis]|uniref:Uncharacterized protein n=1 Tax=Ilex paraguariensis TaxID=185542 RepID=A0ABC8V0I3_9AQUA